VGGAYEMQEIYLCKQSCTVTLVNDEKFFVYIYMEYKVYIVNVAGTTGHGDESSGSVRVGEFLDQLTEYSLVMICDPWS
jgi:hypothetical protein